MYGAGLAQAGRAMQSRHRHHVRPEGPSATSVAPIASVPAQTRAAAARAGLVRALIASFSRGEAQGRKQPVGLDLG
jgi:hypothetical protein